MATLARFGLVALTAIVGGCATSYAPESAWNDGGFSEQARDPGIYQVWFVANEQTLPEKSDDLALLRAADLCMADARPFMLPRNFTSGHMDVRYVSGRVNTKKVQIAGLNADNTPHYPTMTVSVQPGRWVYRTRSGLEVVCLPEPAEYTQDAASIARELRQRYGLPVKSSR